jgi:5-methylcytosine-specific restriction endonuclease McrA
MNKEHAARRNKIGREKKKGMYNGLLNDYLGLCVYCQSDIRETFTIDHIETMSNGGTDDIYNLVPCCKTCNSTKHDKTLLQFLIDRPRNNVERYLQRFAR